VFELGYFYGYLGRRNVVALYERGVELPSDMQGIAYIEVSKDGGWRANLVKELRDAGLELDANKI
jgi:predicted nucleotide-binding protein